MGYHQQNVDQVDTDRAHKKHFVASFGVVRTSDRIFATVLAKQFFDQILHGGVQMAVFFGGALYFFKRLFFTKAKKKLSESTQHKENIEKKMKKKKKQTLRKSEKS